MTPRRIALALAGIVTALVLLTGCMDKYSEPFKDAPRGTSNKAPADVGTMPDGFSNWSTKCDHGNRVYVAFHGDNKYAALDVVPSDPTCR